MKLNNTKMKKRKSFGLILKCLAALLIATNLSSCKDDNEEEARSSEQACIVLNQGNFTEANGSISVIDKNGNVTNHVYSDANGYPLASTIESGFIYNDKLIIICNNEDKIEIVDANDFKRITTIKGIVTPRYGTVADGFLYVTSVPDWNLQSGLIYKIDLASSQIDTSIVIEGQPEGIISHDGKLIVAAGASANIINTDSFSVGKTIMGKATLTAKHFTVDKDGEVWMSLTSYEGISGISKIDFDMRSITNFTPVEGLAFEGHLSTTPDKSAIVFRTITGAYTDDEASTISLYDIASGDTKEIIQGKGFYGFNVDQKNGDIYTADTNGWITNSTLLIHDAQGTPKSTDKLLGVGACRFILR